jgi:hypothetical protein
LEKSITDDEVLAGKVNYVDYKRVQPFDDDWDYVLHKREGFRHEQEMRLIKLDAELHKRLLAQEPIVGRDCLYIPWDISAGIENILVSPYAADWYLDAVRATVGGLGGGALAESVRWSELRAMAQF